MGAHVARSGAEAARPQRALALDSTTRCALDGAYAHAALRAAKTLGRRTLPLIRLRLAVVGCRWRASRGTHGHTVRYVFGPDAAARKEDGLRLHDERRRL